MGSFVHRSSPLLAMAQVQPASRPKIVKKHRKRFTRHQSDRYDCVHDSWRKPRGIDSRIRRRFRGTRRMVKIGYGSNQKTRHMLPDGFLKFRVFNAAEIASTVSQKKRKAILERAAQLNIKVVNASA